MSTMGRLPRAPARASSPFSISGSAPPFFTGSFEPASGRRLPCPPEAPHSGFGYPLCGFGPLTLEGLFQPSTLMGFSLQSVSLARRSKRGLPCSLRSCAFVRTLFGLVPALQRLSPARRAVPLSAIRLFRPERGRMLSWVSSASQALSPTDRPESISLSGSPSRPLLRPALRPTFAGTPGVVLPPASHLPSRGRGPVWPFSPFDARHLLRRSAAADYFFVSELPGSREPGRSLLCSRSASA